MKVLKFGGSSIGNAGNIEKVVEIVKSEIEKDSCVVVLSAMQGTTDALIEIGKAAENGDESFREKILFCQDYFSDIFRARKIRLHRAGRERNCIFLILRASCLPLFRPKR